MRAILHINGKVVSGDIVEMSISHVADELFDGYVQAKTTATVQVVLHE